MKAKRTKKGPFDVMNKIIAFETGELDQDGVIELFQYLVDTGMAWTLQGYYGRTAMDLLKSGQISSRELVLR